MRRHSHELPATLLELIRGWADFRSSVAVLARQAPDLALQDVTLVAPIDRPGKIMAIGLNYADHVAEARLETPRHQTWFSKAVTAVNGPFGDIELPVVSTQLDYECEMVAIIGKRCRHVPRSSAMEVVFAVCAGNDVSVRDWQLQTGQWVIGKSFDTHCPFGPWLTTLDEVDPAGLDMSCRVNGELRQASNTRELIFDLPAQIEHLTRALTLEPGDVIFTGTCGGVGLAMKPPRWLRAGDVVRVEIDKLGAIENRVVQGSGTIRIG